MSEPYLGQLSLVGFSYAPLNWALAAGQILAVSSNAALFALLGKTYGGNGTSTFALPNLQGAVAVGFGQGPGLSNYVLGETGGTQTVTLNASATPSHSHPPKGATRTVPTTPVGNAFSDSEAGNIYSTSTSSLTGLGTNVVSTFGSSQPHDNMMPYLGMYWIIALSGIFPTRSS